MKDFWEKIIENIYDFIFIFLIFIIFLSLGFSYIRNKIPYDIEIEGIHIGGYNNENISKQ